MSARIPATVVTGFLGAGKTTLINRWLRSPTGERLGVVVNEFGQIGIDGALLGPGDVVEFSDGCVCCAKGTELWEAALSLVDRAGATHLLVETSGIADPAVLLEQYDLLPEALHARLDLAGVLCVVDTLHLEDALERRAEARSQLRVADRLLLTKGDLSGPEGLTRAHARLDHDGASPERAALQPDAPRMEVLDAFRWAFTARPPQAQGGHGHEHAHEHHHDRQLVAVSLAEAAPLLEGPLRRLFADMRGEVLRAKGFVRLHRPDGEANGETTSEALALVELAGRRVELRPLDADEAARVPPGSTLVFIGEGLDEAWLRLRLSACRAVPSPRHP